MSSDELFSLQGKTVLISGASSGLGEHFARVMASSGATVVVAARRFDRLTELANEIEKSGGSAHALEMDVTSPGSVNQAFETLDGMISNLDILVNGAGISSTPTKFLDMEEDGWGYLLDVNLKGAWRVGRQAGLRMKSQGFGAIVNIASMYSHCTGMLKTDYNVSKAAVLQLTKNMALELGRAGVRVNALCPGYIASAINEVEFSKESGKAYIARLVPQRLGEMHELDGPLLLLASDASSFMNGSSIVVDGGSVLIPV
jgi:NAD(P)-dependent dehydrogenase (short-subunit alcohol dehydrogenase family)